MSYHCINLKGTRSAVVDIVLGDVPPGNKHIPQYPQGKHCCHANTKDKQPMDTTLPWLVFRVLGFCCSFCFALRRRAIVDHILAVATPDYWGCFLSCRVAYRASGHKRRKYIFILFCLKLYQLLLPVG